MKHLKSTKSRVIQFLASLIVLFGGLIPMLGIFSGGRQSALASDITEYNIPSGSNAIGITSGPDGNLWFAEHTLAKIGKITTNGTITEYDVPNGASPYGITSGPDGNLWFTEEGGQYIDKITTSGTITKYFIPSLSSPYPYEITSGPDGNLWFTEAAANKIGKITTSGTLTEYDIPTLNGEPEGITSGPDGNLWFTEADANKIGKITPSGMFTEYTVPNNASIPGSPVSITSGPDGNLWFTNNDTIGKITPMGNFTAYTIPNNGLALAITSGPDGNLWFSDAGNRIWKITTSGTFTGYDIPDTSTLEIYPQGITFGPDRNLWFSEYDYSKIGVLHLSGVTPSPTSTPTTIASGNEYVALGDSYASGEGIRPFFEAYSTCHRSTLGYPVLVDVPGLGSTFYSLRQTPGYAWGFNACSGDTTAQVDTTQLIRNADPTNKNFLKLSAKTTLVTVTVGGDDLEFANVLKFCALNLTNDNCANDIYTGGMTLSQWANAQLPILKKHLQNLYADIHKDAPNARILVVGYPQLFPASKAEQNCVQLKVHIPGTPYTLGYSNSEQDFLRAEDAALNSTLSKAVDASQSQMPITFVNVLDGFAGHEVCGNSGAYINGPSMQYIAGQIYWGNSFSKIIKSLQSHDYSFHPSIPGQAEYAKIINTLL